LATERCANERSASKAKLSFVEPLANGTGVEPPSGEGWLDEIKHDRYRTHPMQEGRARLGPRVFPRQRRDRASNVREMTCRKACMAAAPKPFDPRRRNVPKTGHPHTAGGAFVQRIPTIKKRVQP
jgi:hypothetical protein